MKRKLEKLLPPGAEVTQELGSCALLLFVELGLSLGFPISFFHQLDRLYLVHNGQRYLRPEAVMPAFGTLMQGKFFGFVILLCGCVTLTITHYLSFYQGSKSIYLMKRLRSPAELHRRCLALPALCLGCGIVLFAALFGLYAPLYARLTPAQCLPEAVPFAFWRYLL